MENQPPNDINDRIIDLINDMIGFFNVHYPVPQLKVFKPDDYLVEYYTVKHKMHKQLQKIVDKRNEEYNTAYKNSLNRRNDLITIINRISEYPIALVKLFYDTVKNQVLNDIKLIKYSNEIRDNFNHKYDSIILHGDRTVRSCSEGIYSCCEIVYNPKRTCIVTPKNSYYFNKNDIEELQKKKFNFLEFCEKYKELRDISHKADSALSPSENLYFGLYKIYDICKKMEQVLGEIPFGVSMDSNWGVGGHYNGIISSRDGRRAKFISFLAGGWNIQKLHIRVKITLLH